MKKLLLGLVFLIGSSLTSVVNAYSCNVQLNVGWNLLGSTSDTAVASVFGDKAKVTTVWKWDPVNSAWWFYTPLQTDGGAAYAASKGYQLLSNIAGGEGFWVNASSPLTLNICDSAGVLPVATTSCSKQMNTGWNLMGSSWSTLSVASVFGDKAKVTTVWKWDPVNSAWWFYTPLQTDGGAAYAASKGYQLLSNIAGGEGFWVNASSPLTLNICIDESKPPTVPMYP